VSKALSSGEYLNPFKYPAAPGPPSLIFVLISPNILCNVDFRKIGLILSVVDVNGYFVLTFNDSIISHVEITLTVIL